jgi:hypothetical protein
MKPSFLLAATITAALVAGTGCHKESPVTDLEKTAAAMGPAGAPAPGAKAAANDPSAGFAPADQVREAISEYKAGKMEDAVTRLQMLRAMPALTPEQRMSLQDSVASVMTEISTLAEKGDARAIAAKAQYERLQMNGR